MNEEIEVWKPAAGLEGRYEISSFGRVRTIARYGSTKIRVLRKLNTPHILKPHVSTTGYEVIGVHDINKSCFASDYRQILKVHILVALAFIPNDEPEIKWQVNHRDGNKLNNNVSNLEWMTQQDNLKHAAEMGLMNSGENNGSSKLKRDDVVKIRELAKTIPQRAIAKLYLVSVSQISNIVLMKQWNERSMARASEKESETSQGTAQTEQRKAREAVPCGLKSNSNLARS